MFSFASISYDLNRDGTPELTRQLDRSHDNLRRPTGFTLKNGTTTETAAIYGYDPYSRLASVGSAAVSAAPGGVSPPLFSYSYLQNSNLLASVIGPVHTVTNTWELDRDVLDAKENKVGGVTVSKLDYAVNAIGQRTALSQTGTAFASVRGIAWAYDSYGQVTSADSTLAAQDRAYQYDAIGNRKKSANSLTLPVTDNYTANALNQYSSWSVGVSPTLNPSYDPDGNATAYPLPAAPTTNSTLTYDSENRLTSTTVGGLTTTQQFDSTGRRISKTTGTNTRLYLYDGWNVIAEYTRGVGVSPTLQKTNLWGPDLSGSMQGAGGVGGLLSESNISNPQSPISYPTYDGNGNISEYLTATGTIGAHFEYDAFGNTTINTDTGNQFTYKFSTKPQDVETGLYYYGYRYYDPVAGRWVGRDAIEERGGFGLYGFVLNDGVNDLDLLGNEIISLGEFSETVGITTPSFVTIEGGFSVSATLDTKTCCAGINIKGNFDYGLGIDFKKGGSGSILGVGYKYNLEAGATLAKIRNNFDTTFSVCLGSQQTGSNGQINLANVQIGLESKIEASIYAADARYANLEFEGKATFGVNSHARGGIGLRHSSNRKSVSLWLTYNVGVIGTLSGDGVFELRYKKVNYKKVLFGGSLGKLIFGENYTGTLNLFEAIGGTGEPVNGVISGPLTFSAP